MLHYNGVSVKKPRKVNIDFINNICYQEIAFAHYIKGSMMIKSDNLGAKVIEVDLRPKKPKKIWWWEKLKPGKVFQVSIVFTFAIAAFAAVRGTALMVTEMYHDAAIMWIIAFCFLCLFCALQAYSVRKKYGL